MRLMMLLTAILILTACSANNIPAVPTEEDITQSAPTHITTATVTATSTPLPTATFTATPTLTPTATQIPEALREEIIQTYKVLLFMEINANLLNEAATRVQSGELSGFDFSAR